MEQPDHTPEGSPYQAKKVVLHNSVAMKDPSFFRWNIYDYINGDVIWPHDNPSVQSEVEQAFSTTSESSEIYMVGLTYATTEEMKVAARFPEYLSYDTTHKTNKYEYKLAFVIGCDGEWQNINFLTSLINREQAKNFEFVFNVALPIFYGQTILSYVHLITSDGDDTLINVIDNAIKTGCFCNAVRRRCFWHMVNEKYTKLYGRKAIQDQSIGPTVLQCVKLIIYHAECMEEFQRE
jgi:hypothetical protein